MSGPETFAFQAEINQLLSLIINTFYSNKDIFLRELISNASDALDKIRYTSLTDNTVLGESKDLEIKLVPNKESKTLLIEDNGIGMTREELIKNLGTIAHSGTRAFIENINKTDANSSTNLIGQFGVGFYSAYLVADNVKVISKANDNDAYVWESSASGSFTVSKYEESDAVVRGTRIILTLKDDLQEYVTEQKITEIIKKHSQYCAFPIRCLVQREEDQEVEEEVKEVKEVTEGEKEGEVTEEVEASEPVQKTTTKINVNKWELINKQQPIWTRPSDEVTKDEYASFYKSISNDWEDHLHVKHFSVDGQVQFKALLYIPKKAPYDMFQAREVKQKNIKLYVKKVLIMDESDNLLPEYLSFIKGVVDSDDLPLNVSREMLQQNNILKVIKKNLIKKCVEMMSEISAIPDQWKSFYDAFANNIKLGVHEDTKNREKFIELLRFNSSNSESDFTSFKEYVSRMKEGQNKIYYVTSDNLKAAKSSPFIEQLIKKKLEVLYLVDTIDEYMIQSIKDYDGKQLVCSSKDGFELDETFFTDEEKKEKEDSKTEWKETLDQMKSVLGQKVVDIKLSDRLTTNPCVLCSDKYGWTANMEKIMKAQALQNPAAASMHNPFLARKILEVNPDHVIMKEIKKCVEEKKDIKNTLEMLYWTTLLDSGFSLEEPSKYAKRVYNLIAQGYSVDEEVSNDTVVEQQGISEPGTNMEDVD